MRMPNRCCGAGPRRAGRQGPWGDFRRALSRRFVRDRRTASTRGEGHACERRVPAGPIVRQGRTCRSSAEGDGARRGGAGEAIREARGEPRVLDQGVLAVRRGIRPAEPGAASARSALAPGARQACRSREVGGAEAGAGRRARLPRLDRHHARPAVQLSVDLEREGQQLGHRECRCDRRQRPAELQPLE